MLRSAEAEADAEDRACGGEGPAREFARRGNGALFVHQDENKVWRAVTGLKGEFIVLYSKFNLPFCATC